MGSYDLETEGPSIPASGASEIDRGNRLGEFISKARVTAAVHAERERIVRIVELEFGRRRIVGPAFMLQRILEAINR